MLAHRLASRTVMTSEREQGTQTSLSFETSSSIREEFMALFLEEQEEEERARLEEEKKDWDNRERGEDDGGDDSGMSHRRGVGEMDWEELKEIHSSHLLDPNYDKSLLLRERQTLLRFEERRPSAGSTLSPPRHSRTSSRPSSMSFPLSYLPSLSAGGTGGGETRWRGSTAGIDEAGEHGTGGRTGPNGLEGLSIHNSSRGEHMGEDLTMGLEDVYTEWGFDEGEEDSVYAEVRAAVANTDDPTMPINTIRVWVLGGLGSIVLSGVNQFFYYRYPSVSVASLVIQLLCHPLGIAMSVIIPRGHWFFNPGPWNIKEHTIVTVCAGVASGTAYATNIITVQKYFYNQNWSFTYQVMLVLSTQLIGFSMGGLLRRFLVWPAAMIWPATLVNTALLNTLHSGGVSCGDSSRGRFFYRVTAVMFVWTWIPSYLFTALSHFDWVTWIVPNNAVVSQLFGYSHGGMVSSIGNPLAMPWWACANMLFGFFAIVCTLYPALYYNGAFSSWYMPFASSGSYDNRGRIYNTSRILTSDAALNVTAYEEYSEIYIPITFSMSYAMSFACVMSTLVHTLLYYRKVIWAQARKGLYDENDIHARLMRKYKEVPQWWYIATFLINLALAIGAVAGWPTRMPVWSLFLALFVAFFFALPIGIVQAISNQQVGLNVVSELIIGYLVPGSPVAMMIFKTFSYITLAQGLNFVSDMKLAHYMKCAPRTTFVAQVLATVLGAFVQLAVSSWMYNNIDGMCDSEKSTNFWCPSAQTFGTSSIIWGLIGPARQFSPGQLYSPILWGFLLGTLVPVPGYILARKYPTSWFKYINFPMVFNVTALMPPYLPINIISFCYTNFLFEFFLRKYRFKWWSRFNYILSAGCSAGYAIAVIFIFFAFQFPMNGEIGQSTLGSWWGNSVYEHTADAHRVPYKTLNEGQRIGHIIPISGTHPTTNFLEN